MQHIAHQERAGGAKYNMDKLVPTDRGRKGYKGL